MDDTLLKLIEAIQNGLPFVSRPYAAIGQKIGLSEQEVMSYLTQLIDHGTIKRLGVVVHHRQLGYRANAMVVWDIPDEHISVVGHKIKQDHFVTLCYRRARHLPQWPYNLYCMIHGKDRNIVLAKVSELIDRCQLSAFPHQVLFSRRCFKQRGAHYTPRRPILYAKAVGE